MGFHCVCVFTYKNSTLSQACPLFTFIQKIPWKLVFFFPLFLLLHYSFLTSPPPCALPHCLSSVFPLSALWTLCLSFISSRITPTLSSNAAATTHPLWCYSEFWRHHCTEQLLCSTILFYAQTYSVGMEGGDGHPALSIVVCIVYLAYRVVSVCNDLLT